MPPKRGGKGKQPAKSRGQQARSASPTPTPLAPAPQQLRASEERLLRGHNWTTAYHQTGLALADLDNDDQLRQETDDARDQLILVFENTAALETATQAASSSSSSSSSNNDDGHSTLAFEELDDDEQRVQAAESARRLTVFHREMAADFIVATGRPAIASRASGRLAMLYLARAGYDLRRAIEAFEDAVARGDGEVRRDAEMEERREMTERQPEQQEEVAARSTTSPPPTPTTITPVQPRTKQATEKQLEMQALNRGVDREPALKHQPDRTKFHITLRRPGPNQPSSSWTYRPVADDDEDGGETSFDWDSTPQISRLNKWRAQLFYRTLGPAAEARTTYLPQEIDWMVDRVRALHDAVQATGARFTLATVDLDRFTTELNTRFAGRVLDGSPVARPIRTEAAVRTAFAREPRIVALTGQVAKKEDGKGREG